MIHISIRIGNIAQEYCTKRERINGELPFLLVYTPQMEANISSKNACRRHLQKNYMKKKESVQLSNLHLRDKKRRIG